MMKSENRHLLLTPAGAGAIAVIRLIGPGVGDFLRQHFSRPVPPVSPPAGSVSGAGALTGSLRSETSAGEDTGGTLARCVHGDLRDGETVIDDVVVVRGEGFVDISTHGGPWVVHCVVELAVRSGFSPSPDPMDGADGDTIIDREIAAALPLAKTELAIDALLAQREAWSRITPDDLPRMLSDDSLLRLLHPPRVAIIGIPNVGKSTLANQLFAQERSITADLPGTTRDWVGELANIDGLAVVLVDTPGLRPSNDPIEQQAIQRSQPIIAYADLLVHVLDPTQPREAQDRLCEDYPAALRVLNKTDRPALWHGFPARVPRDSAASTISLPSREGHRPEASTTPAPEPLRIVATTGEGVDELRRCIQRYFHCEAYDPGLARCWTDRQRAEIRGWLR